MRQHYTPALHTSYIEGRGSPGKGGCHMPTCNWYGLQDKLLPPPNSHKGREGGHQKKVGSLRSTCLPTTHVWLTGWTPTTPFLYKGREGGHQVKGDVSTAVSLTYNSITLIAYSQNGLLPPILTSHEGRG